MSATERLRNVEDFSQLLDRHDTWLFDCDGVLWRESTPIEGSVEFLRFLRAKGALFEACTHAKLTTRQESELYSSQIAQVCQGGVYRKSFTGSGFRPI